MLCLTHLLLLLVTEYTTGMAHLTIINASWGPIHKHENLKRKLYNCSANIYFNQECLQKQLIPNYAISSCVWLIITCNWIHNRDSPPEDKIYRVSQEEGTKLWESVPYVELYRYNPKHLYPRLNGYRDNGQRSLKLWQLLHTYWLPNIYVEIKCQLEATEVFICRPLLHLVGILFPHINDDARSKSHQITKYILKLAGICGFCNVNICT